MQLLTSELTETIMEVLPIIKTPKTTRNMPDKLSRERSRFILAA
jgi:hypothetical protein